MPRKTGATIPADTNPPESYRRVLCIPGTPEWLALVNGALWVLTQSWYWDAASGDVQAVTERAGQMYFEFQDESGDCDVVHYVGELMFRASENVPDGWLMCNGAEVAKADYPALWDEIGTIWGAASNPTDNFLLPDYRNRFPLGSGMGSARSIGSIGGTETVTLTASQIPPHTHDAPVSGAASGGVGNTAVYGAGIFLEPRLPTQTNTGGGGSHNNMPPYAACWILIYAGE